MNDQQESRALADRLSAPMARIVEQHRDKISALLMSGSTSTVGQALGKDENVRRVASFCYPLLPGLVRLVVKEDRFVHFVMHHRQALLAHLPPPPAAQAVCAV